LKLLLAFLIGFMVNQMFGYNIVEGQDNQTYTINTSDERCSGGNRRLNLLLSEGRTKENLNEDDLGQTYCSLFRPDCGFSMDNGCVTMSSS